MDTGKEKDDTPVPCRFAVCRVVECVTKSHANLGWRAIRTGNLQLFKRMTFEISFHYGVDRTLSCLLKPAVQSSVRIISNSCDSIAGLSTALSLSQAHYRSLMVNGDNDASMSIIIILDNSHSSSVRKHVVETLHNHSKLF